MSAPVAPPPAAPAAPAADAPKTLNDIQRGVKSFRVAPAKAPLSPTGGSTLRVNGKALQNPAQKAGAPAPTPDRAPDGKFVAAAPAAPAAPARGEGAEAAVAAKQAVTEQVMGEPEQPRRYKVKVDGQEREVLDSELVQSYQIRAHLDKQMRQIAEYTNLAKKDFNGLVHKLAQEYGQDPQKIAEQILLKRAEAWQEEQSLKDMSPEQREYYQLKKEKAARDAEAAEATKLAEETKAKEAKTAEGRATYEKTTNILIEAHKMLPEAIRNHPDFNGIAFERVKNRLAALAQMVPGSTPIDDFLASIDPKALAQGAMEDHRADLRLALETAGEDDYERLIPESVREKIIARSRAAVQARHPALQSRPVVGDKVKKPAEKEEPKPLNSFKPSMASMINRGRR